MNPSETEAVTETLELAQGAISGRFVVIPTRLNRPTLLPLVEACKQVATTIVVHTEPGHAPIRGTVTLHDFSLSIQAWWNTGLTQCAGPTLVLNDDIYATPEALTTMLDALDSADVVYLAGHREGHATPLTGWCFGIRPDVIRPDLAFGWWAGDDDLYLRAARDGLRIAAITIRGIEHRRVETAFENPAHAAMVESDMRLLGERWGRTVNVGGVVQYG